MHNDWHGHAAAPRPGTRGRHTAQVSPSASPSDTPRNGVAAIARPVPPLNVERKRSTDVDGIEQVLKKNGVAHADGGELHGMCRWLSGVLVIVEALGATLVTSNIGHQPRPLRRSKPHEQLMAKAAPSSASHTRMHAAHAQRYTCQPVMLLPGWPTWS